MRLTSRKMISEIWSFVGAVLWATGVTLLGYFLGGIPFLQKNIEAALVAIVLVSVLPMLIEWWRHRRQAQLTPSAAAAEARQIVDEVEHND